MDEIQSKIKAFLGKYIRKQYRDDDHLFELGLVNSLFAMQLVNFLEKTFELSVENEDLEIQNFQSVQAICRFVERKTAPGRKTG